MRPDLFAGPAMRDDSHRILARLANGGSVPAPARNWNWNPPYKARIVAVAALLAAGASAWTWLRGDDTAAPSASAAIAPQASLRKQAADNAPAGAAPPQAATIVNATSPQDSPAEPVPVASAGAGTRVRADRAAPTATAAPAPTASKPGRQRPANPAVVERTRSRVPAPDSDEDVTLLTAMLKHATPQKPAANPPKE
jgi:hypothetical protein